jgi:hypothetical protein
MEIGKELAWGEGNLTLMHTKDQGWGAIFQACIVVAIINKALVRSRL